MQENVVAVILGAGKGTRMKSKKAKALAMLCGQPLAYFPIRAARAAGIERVIMVVGHQADDVKAAIGEGVEYALQMPQNGTGHAVMMTADILKDFDGTVLVHCVDVPLLPSEVMKEMVRKHQDNGNAATLLTAIYANPGKYGRIIRDSVGGNVLKIVEARDASPEEYAVKEINVATYCFNSKLLFNALQRITPDNDQNELYLTDVIEILIKDGHRVGAVIADKEEIVAGINDRVQLSEAEEVLRRDICRKHMENGVTITDPKTTFIELDVEIGQDTIIHPFTMIFGKTIIGEDCVIGPSSQIYDAVIENGCNVISSRVEKSILRTGAEVGPFSRLRPGCEICSGGQVGNFSEMKNTKVGARSKVHHLGYLGDTTLGEDVNIGADTVTCNYDGRKKHKTSIGNKAFIGSGTLIVAPINIGDNALTGAGSVVTKDIPENKMAYGVPARTVRDRE